MHQATSQHDPWPALPYDEFRSTQYLLHMTCQAIGKLKLTTPFEPHWANVALWLTSRGITTGPIQYREGIFSVDIDFINNEIICTSSWGKMSKMEMSSQSVAQLTSKLFDSLHNIGVEMTINLMPQEIQNPIAFDQDKEVRQYNVDLANRWWRILISSYNVLQRYHSHFRGITPSVGLMWGTFDLRDARYKGSRISTEGINSGYIRRNAMDDAQVEAGWWSGNEQYPRAAYFSFLYPQPKDIERVKVKPAKAKWDNTMGEFILDYDDVRTAKDPAADLLAFFESTYQSESEKADWNPKWIAPGEPV
jgi:hypothetical protein